MDDATARAASWCDEARGLCEGAAVEVANGHPGRSPNGSDVVLARLDAVAAGMRVRRQLDGREPDEATERARRAVVGRLAELERLTLDDLADLRPGTARHREVTARARQCLSEARVAAQNVRTVLEFEPLHQAMAIEALRADLEWLGAVVARLDGEAPPAPSVWLDAEIERLRGVLGRRDGRHPDELDDPLRTRCEAMQAALLERRVRRELARPVRDVRAEALWMHRFRLSRLQAHVAALDRTPDGERAPAPLRLGDASGPDDWLRDLERRRAELADAADARIAALPPRDRREPCSAAVSAAFDEIGETTALLEQMPPHRAVRRLELAREDLERLGAACRLWAADRPGVRDTDDERVPPLWPEAGGRPIADRLDGDGEAGAVASRPLDLAAPDDAALGAEGRDADREALAAVGRQARRISRLARRVRGEWREKLLAIRMEALLGRRGAGWLENAVIVLIPVLVGLIAAEWLLERTGPLTAAEHRFFAWADLAICSVLLVEVAIRIALAPERGGYLLRHLLIDLLPSLPFGFVAHQIDLAEMSMPAAAAAGAGALEWLADAGRMVQVLRATRLVLPLARLARIALILLRLSDRLVRRMAGLLNRNIVLFEPSSAQRPESGDRHRLLSLRSELEQARADLEARLGPDDLRRLASRVLGDFDERIVRLPPPTPGAGDLEADTEEREIPVEAVVERLIRMTPERLVDRMGPGFVAAVDRYLRLLDIPLIRRLPGVRNLIVYREKSPAEAVALAANYLGHLIQRGLDIAYFLADLHGTLSPPVFLDRLGSTIVNATRVPAKRLLILGSAFLVLFLIVNAVPLLAPFRAAVDLISKLLGWPVIILGVICLGFWSLGAWFRRIANQSADFCERVVEAQFAAHTKGLKARRRDQDARFLSERVIDPELRLRSSDDREAPADGPNKDEETGAGTAAAGRFLFENRELAFLRNVRLLYQDYLDGSPLHRSDTKASIQLLGNLALANLRRSHLRHLLRESRMLDRLDLSRAGGLLGGPYLWFNYITRLLVQETALLLLDYNRHAIPLDRLACSPEPVRQRFRSWLAPRPSRGGRRPRSSSRPSSSRRSTSWRMTPSATARSRPGSGPRSPSWCGATASRTCAARSGASRSTNCPRRPARSTRSRCTSTTSPAAEWSCSPGSCSAPSSGAWAWPCGASTGSSRRSCIPGSIRTGPCRRTPTGPRCGRSTACASRCSWDRSGCVRGSTWNTWGCPCPRHPRRSPRSR